MEPEFIDIPVEGGDLLRIVYVMTIGDIIVAAVLLLLLVFLVLSAVMKTLWR